jgi:transcriptional regulator with XRE-family HTH domain
VDYTQLFRNLREARELTLDQLAALGRVHRNTVVNIESGRQVKFKTIAALMQKMGYPADSPELRSMALLWMEAISGLPFSRSETEGAARKAITGYRSAARQAARQLDEAVAALSLTPDQIKLLIFAARHPEIISIIESIRDVALDLAPGGALPAALKAAEDQADYGPKS